MAKITIGHGFMPTPTQEAALLEAATAFPEDWTIEVSGGKCAGGIWNVRFLGPNIDSRYSYGPEDVDNAILLLQNKRLKQQLLGRTGE
jgi:hypothetical protein